MPRGWCWYWILQGKVPEIQIGNQRIPLVPGRGMGWLIWYSMLTGQQPQIKVTEKNDIEELKEIVKQLAIQIEELKRRIEELERR